MSKKKKSKKGVPPYYTDPAVMQEKIDEYFKLCEGQDMVDEEGNPILNKHGYPIRLNRKPPTITGLALHLGFNSRQSLLNYQAKDDFMDTITRAKSRVEEYTEGRLFDRDGVNGAKFSLINNFKGWSEKPVEDEETKLEQINSNLKGLADLIQNPVSDRKIEDE